jgi:hypothetical protein
MQQLDDYTPTIPDSVTAHYLARSGTVYLLLDVMRPVLLVGRRVAVTSRHHCGLAIMQGFGSNPDPDWLRIQSGQWIRIRIRNPDPGPGGQK